MSFKSRFGRFCSASAGLFYVLYSTLEQRGFCHSKLPHRRFSNVGNCSSGTLCLKQLITFRGVSSLEFVQKDEIFLQGDQGKSVKMLGKEVPLEIKYEG